MKPYKYIERYFYRGSYVPQTTRINFLLLFTLLTVFNARTFAQQNNITLRGKVADAATKQPLGGATVHIKGTTHEVLTNDVGEFNFLTGQRLPVTFQVSYVGYKASEITFSVSTFYDINLQPSASQLNDVVVVGYGTQRRSDVTGSIASVPKANLNQATASVDNLLRGATPGIQVTQSSGQPGASASIRIRGGNSITGGNEPLYVIDGFPVYNDNSITSTGVGSGAGLNALSSINPSDIESIDILKDASATAIYGSRGANGVVIITTKKGKKGTNNVSYQTYFGSQKITRTLPLLDAEQWARLRNDILVSIAQPPSFTTEQIAALGKGTDWQGAAFREAPVQNHELSISGGDEKSRYAIGGNYFLQKGIVQNTDFKRYSLRFNYDRNISSAFKIGLSAVGSRSSSSGIANNNGGNTLTSPNIITNILTTSPVVALKNSDGSYNTVNPYSTTPTNPIQDLYIVENNTSINRVLSNFSAEYKLAEGLTAKINAGVDLINTKQNYFAPSNSANGFSSMGFASVGTNAATTWLSEYTLVYDKIINNDHSLNILGGYTTQSSQVELATSGSRNFVTNLTGYNSLQSGSQSATPTSDAYDWTLNSYLARINYSYQHKYNLTLSARADGSSRFGAGYKWGYFPSAGFSWNAGQEEFFKNFQALSNLKVRFSVGKTGNQEIGQYLSLSTLVPVTYNFNGAQVTGFAPGRLSNKELRWEKTTQYDAGLDLGFLKDRIEIVFDIYYKRTSDLLLNVPLPNSTGYSTSLQNIGSVENKGIELAINTDNLSGSKFTWHTSLVYSLNRNKVLDLGIGRTSFFPSVPSTTLGVLQPVNIIAGQPLGTFWGYKTAGIFQSQEEISKLPSLDAANTKPGDRRYQDIVLDGRITTADKVILGNPQPKFTGSFTNTFAYKGIDLLVFFQGSYGNKVYNALRQQLEIPNLSQNVWVDLINRWTSANPGNEIPRAANSPVAQMSDRYIEDGSYLRLKNIALGYSLPKSIALKLKSKNVRVYVSAQNLVTWTKYTGYDPEVNSFEQNSSAQGIDYGAYPNYKTFLAGLNITF